MGKRKNPPHGGLVYSTRDGRMCPICRRPLTECPGHRTPSVRPGDGVVRIQRETKGRKGKVVTLITGVPLDPDALSQLAKQLKKKCGSGGTVRDGIVEIQGDHCERLMKELETKGWTLKRSGG